MSFHHLTFVFGSGFKAWPGPQSQGETCTSGASTTGRRGNLSSYGLQHLVWKAVALWRRLPDGWSVGEDVFRAPYTLQRTLTSFRLLALTNLVAAGDLRGQAGEPGVSDDSLLVGTMPACKWPASWQHVEHCTELLVAKR